MPRYALHSVAVQEFKLQEDEHTLTVPAVITREGVYDYDGMLVYEPAEEVEKAAFTAANAWIVEEHPPEVILVDPAHIRGTVREPVFVEDRIKADLVFYKDRSSPKYLEEIKTGRAKSVSIGFFFKAFPEKGEFKGKPYDYVKRDILIDHVAVGSWTGKCSYPTCGIGVDTKSSLKNKVLLGAKPCQSHNGSFEQAAVGDVSKKATRRREDKRKLVDHEEAEKLIAHVQALITELKH